MTYGNMMDTENSEDADDDFEDCDGSEDDEDEDAQGNTAAERASEKEDERAIENL